MAAAYLGTYQSHPTLPDHEAPRVTSATSVGSESGLKRSSLDYVAGGATAVVEMYHVLIAGCSSLQRFSFSSGDLPQDAYANLLSKLQRRPGQLVYTSNRRGGGDGGTEY